MEEKELVARAKEGCADAMGEIVARHKEPVYGFLLRYAGQAADAEDLCQETFIRAFKKLGGFRGESRLRTWLLAIAANTAKTWHRREGRRRKMHVAADEAGIMDWAEARGVSRHSRVEREERAEAVRDAIGRLGARERTALILRTYEGMRYEEIGEVIGCSGQAVGNMLHRARGRLSKLLRRLVE